METEILTKMLDINQGMLEIMRDMAMDICRLNKHMLLIYFIAFLLLLLSFINWLRINKLEKKFGDKK